MKHGVARYGWVDVLKFLGIFAIYLGHFNTAAGRLYPFVFLYHVPLFFFVAGFFSGKSEQPARKFIREKLIRLMVPYLIFSLIAIAYYTIQNNWSHGEITQHAKTYLRGIRNQIDAGSLWFIPCLFIVTAVHHLSAAAIRNGYLVALLALASFFAVQFALPFNPVLTPRWFMNLDSALYYWVYYAMGAISFPLLKCRLADFPGLGRLAVFGVLFLSFAIAVVSFFHGDRWMGVGISLALPFLLPFQDQVILISYLPIAMSIILMNVVLAKLLEKEVFLQKIGRQTLLLCGTENVFKDLFHLSLSTFGLSVALSNPISTSIYTFVCLTVSYFTFSKIYGRFWARLTTLPAFRTNVCAAAPSSTS